MKKLVLFFVAFCCLSSVGCRYHYDGNCPNNNCVEEATVEGVTKEVAEGDVFVTLFVRPATSDLIRITDKIKLVKILDEKYGRRLYVVHAGTPVGGRLAKQAEVTKFPAIIVVRKVNGALTLERKLEGFSKVEEAEKFLEGN